MSASGRTKRKFLEENLNRAQQTSVQFEKIATKGDRMIAFAAGGAFLGGLIAQISGAIVGALMGATFDCFVRNN
ncbi:hypothetical protein C7B61_08245 [filamentous cyanobacterium CCP1]|nr:hypothetical protein C7B76_05220 [filamentous cyanobacterium CCP2]PSB67041.1 hypothetical protein C7B61_08245 [filamentous cyanobacterium CCP1]